jgi:hypothetical protein
MPITPKGFKSTIKEFSETEDSHEFWPMARNLLLKGYEIEAYILILATWNFAGFRYLLKDFDLGKFRSTIKNLNSHFDKLKNLTFEKADLEDDDFISEIKFIYQKLKDIVKQIGATKMMALKNPGLFVMWDTKIREMYRINNKATPDDYIKFLKKMKEEFGHIKWTDKKKPFAKAIDEYNYIKTHGT